MTSELVTVHFRPWACDVYMWDIKQLPAKMGVTVADTFVTTAVGKITPPTGDEEEEEDTKEDVDKDDDKDENKKVEEEGFG